MSSDVINELEFLQREILWLATYCQAGSPMDDGVERDMDNIEDKAMEHLRNIREWVSEHYR